MNTPFVLSTDIASINEAFSTSPNAPWGFSHDGIDFMPSGDLKPFQAVVAGVVASVTLNQNSSSSNWQVNVEITYNAGYSLDYIFEPFSTSLTDGQAQLANVVVTKGQAVSPGDIVGRVHAVGGGAHLHFGLRKNSVAICPEPYFTPVADAAVLDLIHETHPTWNMCY